MLLLGVPPPVVSITDEGQPIAGYFDYALICSVKRDHNLSSLSNLTVQWLDSSGSVVTGEKNINVSGSGPTNDAVLISRLNFSSLYTSQAGVYTCRASLTIPDTLNNYSIETNFSVYVKS